MTAIAEVLPVSSQTDLVRRAARGDALAFERLLAARADGAFRIARAMLGDESDARDATQDAFVSAWRELPRLRDPERFDPWLRRILVNACRAQMRVRSQVREIRLDLIADRSVPGPGLSEQLGATDMLARAFDRLNGDRRALLVLHYLDHAPVAEISASLGIPTGTVKWRLHDAREALQRALVAEGEDRR
ncbi:MAG TPA: RNA polymerase sigma factor [Candidatus Limnocylindrales bacterium]|nr:RNA polymerase sigma factor [Candidatus Limnocylindrales bacterium]